MVYNASRKIMAICQKLYSLWSIPCPRILIYYLSSFSPFNMFSGNGFTLRSAKCYKN